MLVAGEAVVGTRNAPPKQSVSVKALRTHSHTTEIKVEVAVVRAVVTPGSRDTGCATRRTGSTDCEVVFVVPVNWDTSLGRGVEFPEISE